MAGVHEDLIEAASRLLNPHRVGDRLFGNVAATLVSDHGSRFSGVCIDTGSGTGFCAEHAVWRDHAGRLVVLPPCGRCREFIRQVDPGNLDTQVVLDRDLAARLSELLPFHEWPGPLG